MVLRNKKEMYSSAQALTNHIQTKATKTILASSEKPSISEWFGKVTINQRWSRGYKARGQGQEHKKIRG